MVNEKYEIRQNRCVRDSIETKDSRPTSKIVAPYFITSNLQVGEGRRRGWNVPMAKYVFLSPGRQEEGDDEYTVFILPFA